MPEYLTFPGSSVIGLLHPHPPAHDQLAGASTAALESSSGSGRRAHAIIAATFHTRVHERSERVSASRRSTASSRSRAPSSAPSAVSAQTTNAMASVGSCNRCASSSAGWSRSAATTPHATPKATATARTHALGSHIERHCSNKNVDSDPRRERLPIACVKWNQDRVQQNLARL